MKYAWKPEGCEGGRPLQNSGSAVMSLLCHFAVIAGAFLAPQCVVRAFSQELSTEDILDGMISSQARIAEIRLEYTVEMERTDAFYEFAELRAKQREMIRAELAKREDSGERGDTESENRFSEAKLPRKEVSKFLLLLKGAKIRFEVFTQGTVAGEATAASGDADKSWSVSQIGVFDGEIMKKLMPITARGAITVTPEERVVPFTRIEELLYLGGQTPVEYLTREDIHSSVTGSDSMDGDLCLELTAIRKGPSKKVDVTEKHLVTINIAKGFWPVKIRRSIAVTDPASGRNTETLQEETQVLSFFNRGGVFYPEVVETQYFASEMERSENSLLPQVGAPRVTNTRRATITAVDINSDIHDSDFDLAFPDGTKYYDARDGGEYLVATGGTIARLADEMRKPRISQEDHPDRNAAFAELRKWKESKKAPVESLMMPRNIITLTGIVGAAFVVGFLYAVLRRRRRVR